MLTLQAILITSCLLLVLGMVGSLLFLATLRARLEPVPVALSVESDHQL
jgi:hypothetical protein